MRRKSKLKRDHEAKPTNKIHKGKPKFSKTLYTQKFKAPLKKTRKNEYDPNEEARLEKIVFGDTSDIINNLGSDEESVENKTNVTEIENFDDSKESKEVAWVDEDDATCLVKDAAKLKHQQINTDAPGKLYKDYLHQKYTKLVGTPKWAELKKVDKESDDLDDEILKHSCYLEKPKARNLRKDIINIKTLTAINKQTHTEGPIVSSVEFHPTSTVALVAGSSGILSLFQIDGIENNKLATMQYNKFPISTAKFLQEGTEILIGSKFYPYSHSYNLISGKTYKILLPHGMTNMQKCEVSPDGKLLAVCGRSGEIYLLTSSSKELVSTLKMNSKCRAVVFTPDNKTLITHGDGNEMYIWDLNSRECIHRAIDDGCLSCESIAVSPSGQFLATGSREGVVNLYDTKTVLKDRIPVPLKVVLNLVTSITSLKFNPYSEILAMASNKKYNAFKMMHLPSFTIFSNYPSFQTNLTMPETINFSPSSGYLSISNRSFSAFLYRLKHYGNY